jgi:hypothetical protein
MLDILHLSGEQNPTLFDLHLDVCENFRILSQPEITDFRLDPLVGN